ncbi:caspase family protein [Pseudorhodobacter sp. E13]|nr:caspase family protein [Pseudorhodobacter sp. E13]
MSAHLFVLLEGAGTADKQAESATLSDAESVFTHPTQAKKIRKKVTSVKRALLIGIDHYLQVPLTGCEKDAQSVAALLSRNGRDSRSRPKNFDVDTLLSERDGVITRRVLLDAVKSLFKDPAEVALLYFAGHGVFDFATENAVLVAQDGEDMHSGISLAEISALASKAARQIKSIVLILDCCQSGSAAELPATGLSLLSTGLTILTSADRHQEASATKKGGVFTGLLMNALEGAAADVRGQITPAAVYSHIDQSLGAWHQRPIYKANVREFVILREVKPRVDDEILEKLVEWFPNEDHKLSLDPSFEPDVKPGTEDEYPPEVRSRNQMIFEALQICNRSGLVEPVGEKHMYYAAMNSQSCRLTFLGKHYRRVAAERFSS